MNLFDKIDFFSKKAQELKTELTDDGTSGKPIVPSKLSPEGGAYPHTLIRAAAKSALIKLLSNPKVPLAEKKDVNKLGDYFRDFLNLRYQNKDLNNQWGSYLSALMGKINKSILSAEDMELGNFYQTLFVIFDSLWNEIDAVGSYKNSNDVAKPTPVANLGEYKAPEKDVMDSYKENEADRVAPGGGLPTMKTSRKNRLAKLAALYKKL